MRIGGSMMKQAETLDERPLARLALALAAAALACSCARERPSGPIRLVDVFDAKLVHDTPAQPAAATPRTEWRFDGAPPSPPPKTFAETHGWEAGPGVAGLAVRDGAAGRPHDGGFPIIRVERTTGLDNGDQLHAFEVRLRVSGGANLSIATRAAADGGPQAGRRGRRPRFGWTATTPVMAGGQMQTYTITPPAPVSGARIRHVLIRPTDAAGRRVRDRVGAAGLPRASTWPACPRA